MVQVYAMALGQYAPNNSRLMAREVDLSSFSFFQRGSVDEFLNFFIKMVIDRTPAGNRAKVEQDSESYFLGRLVLHTRYIAICSGIALSTLAY